MLASTAIASESTQACAESLVSASVNASLETAEGVCGLPRRPPQEASFGSAGTALRLEGELSVSQSGVAAAGFS
jgi:hypothetical protein